MLFATAAKRPVDNVDNAVHTAIAMRSGTQRIQSGAGGMNLVHGGLPPLPFSRVLCRLALVPEDFARCIPHMLSPNHHPVFGLKDERITLYDNLGHAGRSSAVPPLRERPPEVSGSGAAFFDTTLPALAEFRHTVDPARKAML